MTRGCHTGMCVAKGCIIATKQFPQVLGVRINTATNIRMIVGHSRSILGWPYIYMYRYVLCDLYCSVYFTTRAKTPSLTKVYIEKKESPRAGKR